MNRTLNEGTFAEIDNAIHEYIIHVKKFDAPVSVNDCIDFVSDLLDMDSDDLWDLENTEGTFSDGLAAQFNEATSPRQKRLIHEAKKVLKEHGYIVK